MKKILLVSHLFYPNNSVGAVRPTKLAEFLSKKGYSVDVVTQDTCLDASLNADVSKIGKIFRLSDVKISDETDVLNVKKASSTVSANAGSSINSFIPTWVKNLKRFSNFNRKGKTFCKNFTNLIKSGKINLFEYDVVITSFGPLHSLFCGFVAKKINPNIRWICDFRDPIVLDFVPLLMKPMYRKYETSSCKKADAVTMVSNGYKERICAKQYESKAIVIPNGFDVEDIPKERTDKKSDKFVFTYVGALYDGRRDISNLFLALKELSDEGRVNLDSITFEYAGKGNGIDILTRQAKKHSVESIINNNGLLKREDCLSLQMRSDVLVLATWNTKEEKGVFPGKMIEYMLFNKPVISLVNGDLENCEITQAINNLKIGFSYEEISGQEKFNEFKEYVCNLVNGKVDFCPDREKVMEYEWNNIVKKFEAVING